MSAWDKTKAASVKAAAATKRAAQKLKLKGEIDSLMKKIVDQKKEFGVKVYDLMNADDMQGAQSCFAESRRIVTGFEEEIANKRTQIEALEAEARAGADGGKADSGAAAAASAPPPAAAAT